MIESCLVSVVVVLALWFMEMSKSLDKDVLNRIETIIIQYNQDNNISSTIYLVMEYGTKKMDWSNSIYRVGFFFNHCLLYSQKVR